MNWQTVIPLLIGGILGFLFKVLYGKLFEKKVHLCFQLDKPTFFSVIPPNVCFQNVKIWNKGNLPSHGLRVTLNKELIEKYSVSYKSSSEENYDTEFNDTFLILKFLKLLPQEELTLSFKSEKPLPQDFLVNVKSDEMLARSIAIESKPNEWVSAIFSVIIVGVFGLAGMGSYHLFYSKKTASQQVVTAESEVAQMPFSSKMIIDKNIYSPGQRMDIIYQVTNTSTEALKDIMFKLEIPGIDLDYDATYQQKAFLKAGEQATYKRSVRIPNDFPHEKHKAILNLSANNLEKSFRTESSVYFEVQ